MEKLKTDILEILKDDSRTSVASLAVMLSVDESECRAAITELESSGIIVGYSLILNKDLIDEPRVEAYIELKVNPSHTLGFDGIAREICRFEEVKSVFLMSGGYDLSVIVEGKTLRDVAMFVSEKLSSLDKIIGTATHFILKRYKSRGRMLEREQGEKRLAVHA